MSLPLPSAPGPRPAWRAAILWAAPLVVALVACASGLGGGFVLDDSRAILRHPVVTGLRPPHDAFALTFWGMPLGTPPPSYRPLATLAFALDHALFGAAPLGFHVVSLVAYLALVHVGQRLSHAWLAPRTACLAACLFAALPVHVEVVSSLVGRADALALLLAFLALLALRPALAGGRAGPGRTALAGLAFLAALLCKENAIVLPAIVGVLVVAGRGRRLAAQLPTLALAAIAAGYLWARAALLPATFDPALAYSDVAFGAGPDTRVLHVLGLLARALGMLAVPIDLCTGRKYAVVARPDGWTPASAIGLFILALAVARTVGDVRAGRRPFVLCALVAWLPFASVFFPAPEALADRFLLAPSYFLVVGLAPLASRAWDTSRGRLAVGAFLAATVALTAFYATRWRDNLTLLRHAVVTCPDGVENHAHLGYELMRRGEFDDGTWHYAVASEGRRRFPAPWRHPARAAERDLAPSERFDRMHALLAVDAPEAAWRAQFAGALERLGWRAAAARVRTAGR